jgi:isopenicillin N synthase-like dioxygenase
MSSSVISLPTLNLEQAGLSVGGRAQFLGELRETARTLGFFYLTGHGIKADLIADVLRLSRSFFDLPEADKLSIQMINSPQFRGYNRAGLEHTRGKPDWREQVDIGPEQAARPIDYKAPPWTRLQGLTNGRRPCRN